jgi:hypothetical protein
MGATAATVLMGRTDEMDVMVETGAMAFLDQQAHKVFLGQMGL